AWGVRILAANRRKRTEAFRPAWGLLFVRETFDASAARGVDDVYEFHIDDSVISVIVDDGEMQVIEGQSGRPVDVEIHADETTFIDVGVGRLRGRDAIRQGKLRLVGGEAALRRYSSIIRPLAPTRSGGSRLDRHGGSIGPRSRGRRSDSATSNHSPQAKVEPRGSWHMAIARTGSMPRYAALFLRLALAAGFLTSVSDRFGLWGAPGRTNVAWGDFQRFTAYTGQLNPWVPAVLIPPLAWFVTAAETVLGFALVLGFRTRYAALASGVLLGLFALGMTVGTGVKAAAE